jgi:hypothetical protein
LELALYNARLCETHEKAISQVAVCPGVREPPFWRAQVRVAPVKLPEAVELIRSRG